MLNLFFQLVENLELALRPYTKKLRQFPKANIQLVDRIFESSILASNMVWAYRNSVFQKWKTSCFPWGQLPSLLEICFVGFNAKYSVIWPQEQWDSGLGVERP